MMVRIFFLLFALFSPFFLIYGQKTSDLPEIPVRLIWMEVPVAQIEAKDYLSLFPLPSAAFSIHANVESRQIQASNDRKSFQLYLHGIPVQGALFWALPVKNKTLVAIPDIDFSRLALPESPQENTQNLVWILVENQWICLAKSEVHQTRPRLISLREFKDKTGKIWFSQDLLYNAHPEPDSLVKCTIFNPDPCSRLQIPYGGSLRDQGDSNNVLLTQAIDTVLMPVHFENDTFSLRNELFQMGEYSLPVTTKIKSTQGSQFFTRNQTQFEEVNVYYHLNNFRKIIDSLGFTQLANYPLKVDAHGLDGMDQSAYSPVLDILAYGDGNVDDGEDAAVIVHEYGHVLSHSALAYGNTGLERKSAEEGICDYLAGSYVKSKSLWQWQRLFKWDGWNEFWSGRELMSQKQYPDSMVGQIHRDGQIFSSALTHMEENMGRGVTHAIVLRSLSLLVPTLNMRQVAYMMLLSDSILFGGVHTPQMISTFDAQGLSPYQIIVGQSYTKNNSGKSDRSTMVYFPAGKSILKLEREDSKIWKLFDFSGRCLFSIPQMGKELKIPLLPQGQYFLRSDNFTENKMFRLVVGE